MIYFGACPKCHGDVTLNRDSYGKFMSCLQCGLMRDVPADPVAVAGASYKARVAVAPGLGP